MKKKRRNCLRLRNHRSPSTTGSPVLAVLLRASVLITTLTAVAPGQVRDIFFERNAVEQSLAHTPVYDICQDSLGFMWFGTPDGLIRYDGYTHKVIVRTPFFVEARIFVRKDGSLWSNASGQVLRLDMPTGKVARYTFGIGHLAWKDFAEADGDIWVGSNGDGMGRYAQSEDRFLQYTHDPASVTSLCNDTIFATHVDRRGNLWIGTQRGLDRYAGNSRGTFVHCEQLRTSAVLSITEDKDRALWLGTSNGLCRYDESRGLFERFSDGSREGSYVKTVFLDSKGELWLLTFKGIARFDRFTRRIRFVCVSRRDIQLLPQDLVGHPFLEDRQGRIWVATSAGLAVYDRNKDLFEFLPSDPQDSRALPQRGFLTALYEDQSGGIWIGTQSGGICLLDRNRGAFLHIAQNRYDKVQLTEPLVSAILEDSQGSLWIGLHHGLDRLDLATRTRIHYGEEGNKRGKLGNDRVMSLIEAPSGTLWIAGDGGLYRLQTATGFFTRYEPHPGSSGIPTNWLMSLCLDNEGTLWLGGGDANGHLDEFDRESLRVTRHHFLAFDSTRRDRGANPVYSIYRDKLGLLWFAAGGWLGAFDKISGQANYFVPDDPTGSLSRSVWAICEDATGTVWTGGPGGLSRLDRMAGTFGATQIQGTVYGILEDNSGSSQWGVPGNLWVLTPTGISKFNPATGVVWNFGPADGVPIKASEWTHACFKDRSGYLYFGGTNGFVRFHPDSVHENKFVPPIVLTSFKKSHAEAEFDSVITSKRSIELSFAENIISFEFAALNYARPEKNHFAYKLEGFDRDWVYCGTRHSTTYMNLEPGSYLFRVKGANNDGVWNEEGTSVRLVVTPPFWKTWWAYSLYGLFIVSILSGLRRYEHNRIVLKHQVELKEVEAKKLKEVDEMKSHFFTNISHEFRTPLTLILGPAKQLLTRLTDEKARDEVDVIHRSAVKLAKLVDELLDVSKIEAREMKLRARPENLAAVVKEAALPFYAMAERRGTAFNVRMQADDLMAYVDKEKIDKILCNLLSNAFKFTPKGGNVDLLVGIRSCLRSPKAEPGNRHGRANPSACLEISVCDSGIGIPKGELEKIFNRFYQVDGSQTREHEGTGIGLALTRELVELHKGRIEVESEQGKGSTFRVFLPLGKEHLTPEEICGKEKEPESGEKQANLEPREYPVKKCEPVIGSPARGRPPRPLLMIVEDNPDVRKYLRSILDEHYGIIEACDGEEGLRAAVEWLPDLIVLDVMMPKLDGFQVCERLKTDARTSHIPVVMLTAKATTKDKIAGFEAGGDEYIMKPFEPDELMARLGNLLEQRKRLHEYFRKHGLIELAQEKITPMDQRFLDKAFQLIQDHMSDVSFCIGTFAEGMGVSRSLLLKKMEALTGESPSELLKAARLKRAAELLAVHAGNVCEVALEVGFNNPGYFAECFRKEFGLSPSQYHRSIENTGVDHAGIARREGSLCDPVRKI